MGREEAHEIIKEHAVKAALTLRNEDKGENPLISQLGNDERFPLTEEELTEVINERSTGLASQQIKQVALRIQDLQTLFPQALEYDPEPII